MKSEIIKNAKNDDTRIIYIDRLDLKKIEKNIEKIDKNNDENKKDDTRIIYIDRLNLKKKEKNIEKIDKNNDENKKDEK